MTRLEAWLLIGSPVIVDLALVPIRRRRRRREARLIEQLHRRRD